MHVVLRSPAKTSCRRRGPNGPHAVSNLQSKLQGVNPVWLWPFGSSRGFQFGCKQLHCFFPGCVNKFELLVVPPAMATEPAEAKQSKRKFRWAERRCRPEAIEKILVQLAWLLSSWLFSHDCLDYCSCDWHFAWMILFWPQWRLISSSNNFDICCDKLRLVKVHSHCDN